MEPLDRIAETLAAHQVNFVVIGNYGAQLHGVEVQTQDADMAFQRERQNLERLMAALADMDTSIRFQGGTVPLPTSDPELLVQAEMWNLRTRYGDLDILYSPAGGGYDQLVPNAEWVTMDDAAVAGPVAIAIDMTSLPTTSISKPAASTPL